jgi:MFS family permease
VRWIVAVAGTALMAVLGSVYAWSLFTQPLVAAFGWSRTTATTPFALAILFLGLGALLGGRWQDRLGPRPVALAGALLWGAGNALAGLGTGSLGPWWLFLTYGAVGGFGIGLGYVTPVATVAKWFPGRRGLGTGLVVMGFGLGAFAYGGILESVPAFAAAARDAAEAVRAGSGARMPAAAAGAVMGTFVASGAIFALAGGACAAFLRDPPRAGPASGAPAAASRAAAAASRAAAAVASPAARAVAPAGPEPGAGAPRFTPARALRTPQFWSLWAMLFLNVSAGILFISSAVPILIELTGASAGQAAAAYGTVAVANGLGRLLWGAVSDRIGRNLAFALLYGSQVAVFASVGGVSSLALASVLFAVVLLGYGGGFGTMPSFAADYFGTRHLGAIYGALLTAWAAAGLVGPFFAARVRDATGSYAGALPAVAVVLAAAMVLPAVTRRPRA